MPSERAGGEIFHTAANVATPQLNVSAQ
jgi:hypothetical protein